MRPQRDISMWLPWVCSAASGCAWAAIAYVLGHEFIGRSIWAGVIAAPLIGIWAGAASAWFEHRALLPRVGLALLSLYGTAVVFGLACGIGALVTHAPNSSGNPLVVLLNCTLFIPYGLTISGYFLVLWPVALANHLFILWVARWSATFGGRDALAS